MNKLSYCIGEYDPEDSICIGKVVGDEVIEEPCGWCVRCKAFTTFLKRTKRKEEQYLEYSKDKDGVTYAKPKAGLAKFKKFCDDLESEYAEVEKKKKRKKKRKTRSDKKDKRLLGPSKQAQIASRKALKRRSQDRLSTLMEILNLFKVALMEDTGVKFSRPGQIVTPGHFYLVNRLENSHYISVYYRRAHEKDEAVASFRFRTASMTFDISFPFEVDQARKVLSKTLFKKFEFKTQNMGRFRSIAMRADKEQTMLAAEVIAKMASNGMIGIL